MKKSINRYNIFLSLLVVPIVSVFLLTFSVNIYASDYYFPMEQNENGHFTDVVINSINSYLDSDNYYYFAEYWSIENGWFVSYYVRWPKADGKHIFAEVYNNGYQFSLYRSSSGYGNVSFGYLRINMSDGTIGSYSTSFDHFYGMGSSSYYAGCDYISNFILKTNDTSSADVVLKLRPIGHEVKPPRDQEPQYDPTDSAPFQVPLISNFTNDYSFLGKTIQYYGNLFNNQLNDIKNFLYDNLLPIFVMGTVLYNYGLDENGGFSLPVLTQTLFLPAPVDVQELIEANDTLHVASSIDLIVDKIYTGQTSIIKTLHNVVPSPTFHIPSCIYHGKQIGDFDIDFSWFASYKSYSDVILGAFLWIGWLYWFFVSVSHLIRFGKSYEYDESSVGGDKGWGIRF